jgi:glycosyltransferase involved in cell wall biosynthesis
MRLAYFSPLPPSKSGIADYSAELLPALAQGADLSVFVEKPEELRLNRKQKSYKVYDATHFNELQQQTPFDLCLYHQGNNPHHEYIYERALQTPGLLVLHEHCLHHLIAWRTLGRKDEEGYWDEMFYAYGRRGGRIATARANDAASEYQQFLLPLNRRLVNRSLGVIVHNEYAASQLELTPGQYAPPVALIPHHLSPRVYELDKLDKDECRRALGLPQDAWVIASFGFVTQAKRIPTLLKAFQRLRAVAPNAMCLIVGEDHWKWSVAPLIEELNLQHCVRLTGYTTERDFFRYLKAVDVVINLRYPTAGETSGTLIRSLGAGKPVIVTDFGQFGELPDDVCLKVTAGPDEERELTARLRALVCRPNLRERLAARAAAWIREHNDINRCAARYLQFAEQLVAERRKQPARRQPLDHPLVFKEAEAISFDRPEALAYVRQFFVNDPNASDYIRVHQSRLLRTVELLPKGAPGRRALELSSYLQMPLLLWRYGNYSEIAVTNWWQGESRAQLQRVRHAVTGEEASFVMHNVNVERDRFPYPDEHFDVALCCELIEHLQEDPLHMLCELQRVLKWGGLLVVTTPNIASAFSVREILAGRTPNIYHLYNRQSAGDRHNREYTPDDVRAALESAGFKVIKLFTENVWHKQDEETLRWLAQQSDVPRELRGDNIYAVGRKLSRQIERFPDTLYD